MEFEPREFEVLNAPADHQLGNRPTLPEALATLSRRLGLPNVSSSPEELLAQLQPIPDSEGSTFTELTEDQARTVLAEQSPTERN